MDLLKVSDESTRRDNLITIISAIAELSEYKKNLLSYYKHYNNSLARRLMDLMDMCKDLCSDTGKKLINNNNKKITSQSTSW